MSPRKTAAAKSVTVDTIKHLDTRKNIPTEELRGFAEKDEQSPSLMLYPRDPSLDPQLVWKGKDEQDREDLQVPVVPIYIQENIHPQALIDDLPRAAKEKSPQLDFFADFNGLGDDLSKRVEFYQHELHWSNRMILGDSLMVMTSLAEKEGLKGKVQTIYLDPPYGIKFGSNWQVSTRKRDVKDGSVTDATRQPEQVKAFRDTWKLGIHSYLAYLRDRLVVSRELLTDSGSIFVQIGDENVHLVRSLMDEVFGAENFVSQISFQKTAGFPADSLANVADHIIWYARVRVNLKFRPIYFDKSIGSKGATTYKSLYNIGGINRSFWDIQDDATRPAKSADLTSQGASRQNQTVMLSKMAFQPPSGLHWKTSVEGIARLNIAGRVIQTKKGLAYLRLLDDFPSVEIHNLWTDTVTGGFDDSKTYVVQTTA